MKRTDLRTTTKCTKTMNLWQR